MPFLKVLDRRFEVPPVALLASCVVVKRTAWPSHPLLGSLVPVIKPLPRLVSLLGWDVYLQQRLNLMVAYCCSGRR